MLAESTEKPHFREGPGGASYFFRISRSLVTGKGRSAPPGLGTIHRDKLILGPLAMTSRQGGTDKGAYNVGDPQVLASQLP